MDEPFLPPQQPADNPPQQKKSAKKTLILWAVLIVMFVAIYQLMAPSPGHHAPPPSETGCSGIATWVAWLAGIVPVSLLIGFFWWQLRNGSKFNLLQEPPLLALADGQLDRAAAGFREVMKKYAHQSQYEAAARYSLAVTLMRQGNLSGAIEETIRVEKGAGLLWSAEIRVLAACLLAQLYALRGQVDAAERWIEDARKRLGRAGQRLHGGAQLRLAEALLRCRQGRFEEAARGLDRDWRQLEGNLVVGYLRAAWLMRAFAAAQLAGPRGDGTTTAYLPLLRGGVCDHLAVEWPELRTFLVTNGLSTAA